MSSHKFKTIKLISPDMKFVDVHVEDMIESDIFTLIKTGRLSQQDFAAWVEHQRDVWFKFGKQSGN